MLFAAAALGLPLDAGSPGAAYRSPVRRATALVSDAAAAPINDKWQCMDESVIHSVGECCECKSEQCRAEGANGGTCADSPDGITKCCLNKKEVCYREGLQDLGTCKKFYDISRSKNTTLYGYTEEEYAAKSESLSRKLHEEMMAASAASTSLAASEDECDTNLRRCRARGGKTLEECQNQHSTCKDNARARAQWQQKQDEKASAAKLAKREAIKDQFASLAPVTTADCKSALETCKAAETAPPASAAHPLDLQCQAKYTVCEARKSRIAADKQVYEEGKQEAAKDGKEVPVGKVTQTVSYDSMDAAKAAQSGKAWDERSAAAAATNKDCEAKLTSCFEAAESGKSEQGKSGPTKVECRAVYDDCWKHNMRRAARAEETLHEAGRGVVATAATAAERVAGGRSVMGEVKTSGGGAAADKAAGALRANDAWGDAWVAETKAATAKMNKEQTAKAKARDAGKPPIGGGGDDAPVDPKAAAEAEAEKEAAQKGRALRNGDPKWQKPEERCMAALADCRDGRDVKAKVDQKDNEQCHKEYTACLQSAEQQAAATAQEDELYSPSKKDLNEEKKAAQKGRALRNGDATFQTAEERCMAHLADCRDGRDAGKQRTVDECHAIYKTCLTKATEEQQAQQASQELMGQIDTIASGEQAAKGSKDYGHEWAREQRAELEKAAQKERSEKNARDRDEREEEKKEEAKEEKEKAKDIRDAEKGRSLRNRDRHWNTATEQCQAALADCRDGRDGEKTNEECHESYEKCLEKAPQAEAATDEDGFVDCEVKRAQCKEHPGKSAEECAAQHAECKKHRAAEVQRVATMEKKKETKAAKEAAKKAAKEKVRPQL